jgi:predicted RNA-binding protein with EMAP domain
MLFNNIRAYKRKRLYKIAKHRRDDLKNIRYDYDKNGLLKNQLSRFIQRNQVMREFLGFIDDMMTNVLRQVRYLRNYKNFTVEKDDDRTR